MQTKISLSISLITYQVFIAPNTQSKELDNSPFKEPHQTQNNINTEAKNQNSNQDETDG